MSGWSNPGSYRGQPQLGISQRETILWQLWALRWLHAHSEGSVTPEPSLPTPQRWPEQLQHSTLPSCTRRYFAIQARTAQLGSISPEKRWQASWKYCISQLQLSSKHLDHPCLNLLPCWGEESNIIPIVPKDQKQKMEFYSYKVILSFQICNVMAIQPLDFRCVIKLFCPGCALLQHKSRGVSVFSAGGFPGPQTSFFSDILSRMDGD